MFVLDAGDAAKIDEAKEVLVRVIGDRRIKGKPLLMYVHMYVCKQMQKLISSSLCIFQHVVFHLL